MSDAELLFIFTKSLEDLMLLNILLQGIVESELGEVMEENLCIGIAAFFDIFIKSLLFGVKIAFEGRKELEHTGSGARSRDELEDVQAIFLLLVGGHILDGILAREG